MSPAPGPETACQPNRCKCGDCYHPSFGPDTDGDWCPWCRDCGCSLTDHDLAPAAPTEARGLGETAVARLIEAVKDVCWRAQAYGETEDGDTFAYIVTKGAMHRLIAQCPGAAFRADSRESLPDDDSAAVRALREAAEAVIRDPHIATAVKVNGPARIADWLLARAALLAQAATPETEAPVAPCSRKDAHDPHEHYGVPASEPGEYREAHICPGVEPFPTTAAPEADGPATCGSCGTTPCWEDAPALSVEATQAEGVATLARRILNTVDPLLPGHEVRMQCVGIIREHGPDLFAEREKAAARHALLRAAERLTDMGTGARAVELLQEWAEDQS